MQPLEETLAQLKAEVVLPLAMREDLVGILALGHKKSDEPYTKEDLDILMTLAKTLAIAISNALLAAEAAQKEKLAVIGTLAAAINHEVCNPLNNIKVQAEGFLLQLQRGFMKGMSREELERKVAGVMETTMSEIDRTAAITTRLSNFAKPVREPVTEPVALHKVVEEVYSLLGHDLELREISVERRIPPDIPPLLVDHRQLQEILFNLVRNAGQAIGQKGKVTIRASRNGEARVAVEIIDTGPGIPPETLQRLFTPFFTTKEEGKGTGLGLFVIKRLVERNEGTLSVSSTVGVGTTFLLEFSAAVAKVAPKQAAA
jgi:signal transduction histidine kinase